MKSFSRIWTGTDPGFHGAIVAVGPENDQPVYYQNWQMWSVGKDDSVGYARRLASLENKVNRHLLESGIFGDNRSRHMETNQLRQFHLIYSSYYNTANVFALMDASACLQATLSRFGQVFKENDTTVRKKFIADGANKKESKLASALTARRLLTGESHIQLCLPLDWTTSMKSPSVSEAIALDFLDAYVAALVCKYQWLTGSYYDLSRRKTCLALALGAKRALTWKDIVAFREPKEIVK